MLRTISALLKSVTENYKGKDKVLWVTKYSQF